METAEAATAGLSVSTPANEDAKEPVVRPLKVLIVVPVHGACTTGFTWSLARAVAHFQSLRYDGEKSIDVDFVKSSILPEGRARLVSRGYTKEATHLMWFDSDMKFPEDIITRFLNHNVAVVGANYPQKNIDAKPTAYLDSPDYVGPVWSGEKASGLQEVTYCGMGAMLVNMQVFDYMALPFFAIEPQPPEFVKHIGEDVYFCRKLAQAGIPVHIDHDVSKEIAHIGEWEFTNAMSKETEIVRQAMYRDLAV